MSERAWFLSLDDARRKCEAWRRDYNEVRPHSAIGNKVPSELHQAVCNPDQWPPDARENFRSRWSKVGGKFMQ